MEALQNATLNKVDKSYYLQTFNRFPVAFERGQGCKIWDVEGNEYIDALAGIAVCNLGHCHPAVVEAIKSQAEKLLHISNFFVSEPQVKLSEMLCKTSGMDRVFLTNSGAESVEGAIKLARKYARSKGRGGDVIAMKNSFHGRTLATIAMGKEAMQKGFGPMPQGFSQVPFNDIEAIKSVISEKTAAIILEPIQGEGGIHVAEKAYLKQLRELCDEQDIVLIFDEIQCGIGRTGKLFAKDYFDVQPDIMTLAKGLGGGVPVGAILCQQKIDDALSFGDHGTTFGGNPLVCAAALASLEVINQPEFLSQVVEKGEYFKKILKEANLPGMQEIRGVGLMLGVVFDQETKPIVTKMLENKVIANATANNVLRLVPPLIISEEEMDKVVAVMHQSIGEVADG